MRPLFFSLLAVVFLSTGCRESTDPVRAEALLVRVQTENYPNWQRAPGFLTRQPSLAAHDDEVEIFVNDVVATALGSTTRLNEWPPGSVIVKEGYSDNSLGLIAIMEKEPAGGWFWAEYTDSGDVLFSGEPTICVGCHQIGDDQVRAFYLP